MIFILNTSEQVTGTLSRKGTTNKVTPYFDDKHVIDLSTGAETFTFSTFANTLESTQIVGGNYVAFPMDNGYKLFQIAEVTEEHKQEHIKTAYCEMAGIELINEIIRATNIPSASLKQALTLALQDTEFQIGHIDSSLSDVHSIELKDPIKVYNFLQSYIIGTYGAEISFRVEIQGGRVVGKYIDCFAERGDFKGVRFEYGKNITGVKKVADFTELATALVCQGKNGTTIAEAQADDKPLGQDWIGDEEAYQRYNKKGSHIFDVFKYDTESPAELLLEARKELALRCQPKLKYEVDVELLNAELNIGDTVYIVDNEFLPPLHLSARVSQIEIHRTDRTKDKVILSNYKEVISKITDEDRGLASLIDERFPIGTSDIKDGAITSNKIPSNAIGSTHIRQDTITTDHLTAKSITADKIDAYQIRTEHLQADSIDASKIQADAITTTHLQAGSIVSGHIQANQIQSTHIATGSISSEHIQTGGVTSDKLVISEGFIKDAMIDNITASKITSGTIDTNRVAIQSEEGNLVIQDNTIQIKDSERVRVQIGKDATNDYSLSVWDSNGKLMFDARGLTEEAIKSEIIRNDMVSPNANISGDKLNINSVIEEINADGTNTIKSTKVQLNELGQTLDVAFNVLKTQADDTKSKTEANTTSINIQQGQIDTAIANTKIIKDGKELLLKDEYSKLEQSVNEISSNVTNQSTSITNLSDTVSRMDTRVQTAESKLTKDGLITTIGDYYTTEQRTDEILNAKGYATISEVEQSTNSLEMKFLEKGGYNLLYNGDFKRQFDCWEKNSDTWKVAYNVISPNGRSVYCDGELNTTKQVLQKEYIGLKPLADTYTLSYWIATSSTGSDGTTNPYRRAELTIYYTDGTASWHSAGNQKNFDQWEKHVVKISRPEGKQFQSCMLGLWCRDTTKRVHYSAVMLEEGELASNWSPNPNEIYDGITTIDRDGITVRATNSNTYTEMDASSFRVSDNNGGTVAEFSKWSTIPNLSAGLVSADRVEATNTPTKEHHGNIHFIYVNGSTGNDTNNGTNSSPYKTVQRAIEDISDIQNTNLTIYVYNSVPGFTLRGISGSGLITLSLQDSAIINGNVLLHGIENKVNVHNESGSVKSTLKNGLTIDNCRQVDVYGIAFRGTNSSGNNITITNTNYCAVNSCDLGGLSSKLGCAIKVQASLLWIHGCIGSNITDVVGQYAFSHVMTARAGTSNVPDYTNGYIINYDGSGRIQNWTGGTFTKKPSSGWNPSYTATQKTQVWNFNKMWSDETLNGWSDRQELIQGYASAWSTGRWTGYIQMTDNMASIRNTITGGTNLSGRLYVQRTSSSGNATGSKLCLYASDGTLITNSTTIDRSQGVWVPLSSSIIQKIQSGAITYFYLKADTNNSATYFKCERNCKIEITYTN